MTNMESLAPSPSNDETEATQPDIDAAKRERQIKEKARQEKQRRIGAALLEAEAYYVQLGKRGGVPSPDLRM